MMDPEATTSLTFWFKNITLTQQQSCGVTAQLQKVTKLKLDLKEHFVVTVFKVIVL